MKNALYVLLIWVVIWATAGQTEAKQETFAEEAAVSALPDGLVLVHVQFTQEARCGRHCRTFPKAVAQLAAAIPFDSVQLSLSQGRWHYHKWGQPLLPAKPAGAELTAHFSPILPPEALPALWGNLSHALGGLFCASLNFVARPEATAPRTLRMQPMTQRLQPTTHEQHQQQRQQQQQQQQQQQGATGVGWAPGPVGEHVLYACLPQEASCTENLTPWLKLLPCRDAAGVGRLLSQRDVVFGADYHSMQVSIEVQRDAQQRATHTTLRQSFTMVLRPPLQAGSSGSSSGVSSGSSSGSSGGRQPPRPGTLSDVVLSRLLGAESPTACPVASTSRLLLQLPPQLLLQHQQELSAAFEQLPPQMALQEMPTHAGTAAEAADAEGEGGAVTIHNQRQQALAAAANVSAGCRATRVQQWATELFTLSPAPDAVAVLLPPSSPAGSSSGSSGSSSSGSSSTGSKSSAAAGTAAELASSSSSSSSSSSGIFRPSQVLLVYDMHRNTNAPQEASIHAAAVDTNSGPDSAADSAAPTGANAAVMPFLVIWKQQAAAAAAAATAGATGAATTAAGATASVAAASSSSSSLPRFEVSRYITGTGQLHGGMTLQLTSVQSVTPDGNPTVPESGHGHQQGGSSGCRGRSTDCSIGSSGDSSGSSRSCMAVCILQVVPWYIRLWLHTLQLHLDGQVVALEGVLLPSYISPAQDRERPLVLDLCLSVPKATNSITLTAQFTKAFLRMSEHPPDAHRGFDVPAATVTVADVPRAEGSSSGSDSAEGGSSSSGQDISSSRWRVKVAAGAPAPELLQVISPLMVQLQQQRPQEVYSPGLVVPLAVPDFSMPYNVICLTSTVLAIFMGGTLKALLWRPGKSERDAADPEVAVAKRRRKRIRVVLLAAAFVVVAVSYDADLQAELMKHLQAFGLHTPARIEL